jgi:DNA polymerase I-like protein with 3'-5' exonuclease and polymerase domains
MKLKAPKTPQAILEKSFDPIVSSHGYSDAQIMFLQGFPLTDDVKNQKALTGFSETTLKYFLAENGESLNRCYRSIFIREKLDYSATNPKKLRLALEKIDLPKYEQILKNEIDEVKPNVIVPLDDIALGAVFPHIHSIHKPKGRKYWIDCYRGSILNLREDWQQYISREEENVVRVIPTIGPQMLYANYAARSYISLDYKRIIENSNKRSPIARPGVVWVAKTYEALLGFLTRQFQNSPKRLTFDIETYGGMISCISLCFDGKEACTVPMMDSTISLGEMSLLYKLLSQVMKNPIEKNNQNIKYDWTIKERHGFLVNNVHSDTMLKGALLYPELPRGLDFWTSIFTDIPYYKDEGKEYNPKLHSRDRLYIYCGYDSLAAHQIAEEMDKELEETGLKEFYDTEVGPSILIYKDMDRVGLLRDNTQQKKLLNKYSLLYASNLAILRGITGDKTLNPRSPAQVGKLVYEDLKYPARTKTDPETGITRYVTNKETLDDLLINIGETGKSGKIGYEILSRTIICRKLGKVIEYIETPIHPDGRFKGTSNICGAETGRSSSSKTIDEKLRADSEVKNSKHTKKLGRSLQTITKHGFHIDEDLFDDFEDKNIAADIRSMFVPSRNCVFIEGDGSGAEARVVFVLANDFDGLAAMDQKPKIHAKTAAMLFGLDANTITSKGPSLPKIGITYYDMGKRTRHAGNYDLMPFRLAQMTHLPLSETERLLRKFHDATPQIRSIFHAEIIAQLRMNRTLINPNGRRRTFFNQLNDKTFKEAYAHIPQGTVSDLTKFTMWRIREEMPDDYFVNYRFLIENHDGILAEVHKDIKDKYIDVFRKKYERPINFNNCSLRRDFELTIPVEISVSETNWLEMQEIHL